MVVKLLAVLKKDIIFTDGIFVGVYWHGKEQYPMLLTEGGDLIKIIMHIAAMKRYVTLVYIYVRVFSFPQRISL